jgi:hypothetical protein
MKFALFWQGWLISLCDWSHRDHGNCRGFWLTGEVKQWTEELSKRRPECDEETP